MATREERGPEDKLQKAKFIQYRDCPLYIQHYILPFYSVKMP